MNDAALWLPAPAKINLGLRVLGRRPDGYHELDTVFHALALADDLVAARTDEPGVTLDLAASGATSGLPVAAGDDNLVVRAGRAFLDALGARGGLRFWLEKRIPAGGGLGGGSSDAAAALRLARALFADAAGAVDLDALAVRLGADVPFFLLGGTARGRGVGERLESLRPAPHLHVVLIVPPFGTPTAAVFENLGARLIGSAGASTLHGIEVPMSRDIAMIAAHGNDLETAAFRVAPALAELRDRGRAAGVADVCLSGSGSTLFVARASAAEAEAVHTALAAAMPADVVLHRTESAGAPRSPEPVRWSPGHPPELDP